MGSVGEWSRKGEMKKRKREGKRKERKKKGKKREREPTKKKKPERNMPSAHAVLASHPGKSLLTSASSSPLINTANRTLGPSSGSTKAGIGSNA